MKFREYLSFQTEHNPSDTEVVDEVGIEYEPTAYYEVLRKRNPLIRFERVRGFPDFRLVANLFGSSSRISQAVGAPAGIDEAFWHRVMSGSSKPRLVSDGPVKEVCHRGGEVNLFSIPAPRHYAQDAGQYITAGLVAARDPQNPETVNLSYARVQLLTADTLALSAHSRGNFWSILQHNKERGAETEISIIVGAEPLLYLVTAARTEGEYSKAANQEDVSLVDGLTHDVPVPAEAEMVIEAKVSPTEEYDEGPFSEYTGYMSGRSTRNYARVTAIMRRRDPVFLDIIPSNSTEHILLSSLARELAIGGRLFEGLPPSGDYRVNWPPGGTHYVALGSIGKAQVGLAKQLGLSLLGADHYLKLVMINEEAHVGRFFEFLANAAANGANRPGGDIEVISQVFCNRLDPSSAKDGSGSKAIWVTRGDGRYSLKRAEGSAELATAGNGVFVGTARSGKHALSILVDPDVEPSDEDQVMWSVATRTQPSSDFHFEGDSLVIDSRKPDIASRRPTLPPEVLDSVKKKLGLASSGQKL